MLQLSPTMVSELTSDQFAQIDAISHWNLSDVQLRVERRMGWSQRFAEEAVLEYRKFITLVIVQPTKSYGMVDVVDEIWHQHVLNTRDYLTMCDAVVGAVIHHEQQPLDALPSPDFYALRQLTLLDLQKTFDGPVSELWIQGDVQSFAKCCNGHIDAIQ